MKLNALALAFGICALVPAVHADNQATASRENKIQVEINGEALEMTHDELLNLDAEMQEFAGPRGGGHRGDMGGGGRGGYQPPRGNIGGGHQPNRGGYQPPRGNNYPNRGGSYGGSHRPPPPRYPTPYPRYPTPYPRYPAPYPRYPVPVPVPVPQAWVCTARPVYDVYRVVYGLRSYSYVQASESALQQCLWQTGSACVVNTCNTTY